MQHEKSDETQKIAAKRNEWKRENDDDGDHHQIIKYMSVVFPTSNRPAEAHQFRSKKRTKLHVIIPMIGPDSDRKVGGAARRFRGRPIGTPRRLMTQSDTRNSLEFILGKKIRRDLNFFFFGPTRAVLTRDACSFPADCISPGSFAAIGQQSSGQLIH